MVNKLPPITGKYGEEFVRQFYNSISTLSLKQISEDKIYTMLMELEPHKAAGLDGLQAQFLIDSAQSIYKKTLAHIINMPIISRVFPKELKKTKVVPIHKKILK